MSDIVLIFGTVWTIDIMLQSSGLSVDKEGSTAKGADMKGKRTCLLAELGLGDGDNFDSQSEVIGGNESPVASAAKHALPKP